MKRALLLIFLFVLASCANWVRSPASVSSDKHFVFDIDWTLTAEVKPELSGQRIIEVQGKKYFINLGVEELIESLLSYPEVKISFYSGGSKLRNHLLLQQIKLADGRTLKDIAYKILNFDDLVVVTDAKPTDKFHERFKKDLTKVTANIENTFMIDDNAHFLLNHSQQDHLVYTGKTFEHFDDFNEAKLRSGEYIPRTFSEWDFARKKMIILKGAFTTALNKSDKTPFKDAMKDQILKMDLERGEWNTHTQNLYNKSIENIKQENCLTMVQAFLL